VILKNDKKDVINIVTTKGKLTIRRTVLRPSDKPSLEKLLSDENIRCIVPLDIALGIDKLPFKMTKEMMCEVAFWAQNQCSFIAAAAILKKIHGIGFAAETVRQVADYVGKAVYEEDTRNAELQYSNLSTLECKMDKSGILYIQMDGATVNTRQKDEKGSTWKENKLGMVFSSDIIHTQVNKKGEKVSSISKKEYTSYLGSVAQFKKYLFACAVRNGYGKYETVVVLSDGATWIRNMCIELFPDAVQILDLFHLCEKIYEYAKAIFNNDETKYTPWAEEIITKFKNGKKADAIKLIEKTQNRKLPKGTVNLLAYVNNNIDKIDYDKYVKLGYYVGSGAIESGNKVVLQKRMKLAGMRWNQQTAQYLLSLRAVYESKLWDKCVVDMMRSYNCAI